MILTTDHPSYATVLRIAAQNPAYRKFFLPGTVFPAAAAAPSVAKVSLTVLPCVHGDPLTVAEIRAAGKNPRKVWKRCSHPELPKGEIVCPCTGCGPKCSGYAVEPEPNADPA